MSISVVLNGYRRRHNLTAQLTALKQQSVLPNEVMLWHNAPVDAGTNYIDYGLSSEAVTAFCTHNLGVWARFTYALNAVSTYVCVLDDDTIPGRRWLENCLQTMSTHPGMLGTVGLEYVDPLPPAQSHYYEPCIRHGWPDAGNNEHVVEVDFVGHAWFFRREWLAHMFREPLEPRYRLCGEDIHFSHMLQKYGGIRTYVPPHPRNDMTLWGSTNGYNLGTDAVSLWESNVESSGLPFRALMSEYFHKSRMEGWMLKNEKQ